MNIERFNVHKLISEDIIDDNGQSWFKFILFIYFHSIVFVKEVIQSETCSSLITKQIDLAMLTNFHAALKYFDFNTTL